MAAVASNHVSEVPRGHETDRMPESTSSFTAVNGATSPAPQPKPKADQEPSKEAVDANNRSLPIQNRQEATSSSGPPRQDTRINGEEAAQKDRRMSPALPPASAPTPASATTATASSPQVSPNQARSQFPQHNEGSGSPGAQSASTGSTLHTQQNQNAMMSRHKRKRSFSQENSNPSAGAYQNGGPPPSPGVPRMPNGMVNGHPGEHEPLSPRHAYPPPHETYQHPPHEAYPPPPPQHSYPPPPEGRPIHPEIYPRPERHSLVRSEYDQPPMDPSMAPGEPRPYYSEAHMAEALQRENRSYDAMQGHENYGSQEEDDDQQGQYADYNGNRSSQSGMEMDRKRRKRVFSNRTKTGCMTCRRRKKKCDEQHPECNNCLRGGFVCEGYTMRNTWQKPTNAKQPIPLQSKNGHPPFGPPGRPPYPPMPRYQEISPEYPGPPQHPMHSHHPSYEGKRGDPITIEDERDMYGRPPSPGQQKGGAWGKITRPYPSNPPHASKYHDERRGSIYEMGPDGQEPSSMQPPPLVHRTGSAQSQYSQAPHPPNHNNTPPNHNVQAAAQAALTHPASSRPAANRRHEGYTEREKMLKGLYYYPLTPALTEDRERCIAAIWRFNNATNPSHGASPEERTRLFRQILSLRPTAEPPLSNGEAPPTNFSLPFGHCGERVVVEAPFHCDYGYNITIGDDVLIGADCRISDTCSVTIGARCIFSPNVKLVCATYPIDPRRRMGSNGPALGRNIVIEEDCWIGANVTILAGVRVGKSSTVGAGSLLHQDVPRFTVVAGNPAKVSRGIYDGSGDGQ